MDSALITPGLGVIFWMVVSFAILVFILLFNIVVITFGTQRGQAYLIFDSQYTCYEHSCTTREVSYHCRHVEHVTQTKEQSAYDTCYGVYLLAEYQRYFVDENVAYYTTGSTGHCAHDDAYPNGQVAIDGLLNSYDGEQRKAYGVEQEECDVHVDEILTQQNNPYKSSGCT